MPRWRVDFTISFEGAFGMPLGNEGDGPGNSTNDEDDLIIVVCVCSNERLHAESLSIATPMWLRR